MKIVLRGGRGIHTKQAEKDPAKKAKGFSEEDYSAARILYKPSHIRVLFIAESPPSSGGFFYFSETIGKDHLFRETMKALGLWSARRRMPKGLQKTPLLHEFSSRGLYLIDTCSLPVDKLSPKDRQIAIATGASRLPRKVEALDPDRILLVKKTIFDPALQALEKAGFAEKVLNHTPIPFPSHGNQRKYRQQLRKILRKHEAP